MIEESLIEFLLSESSVTDLVENRIYPEVAKEGAAYPFIVYQNLTEEHPLNVDGTKGNPEAHFQLSLWGSASVEGYKQTRALKAVMLDLLNGYQGLMGSTWVQMAQLEQLSDAGEPPEFGKARGDSRVIFDLFLGWEEPD